MTPDPLIGTTIEGRWRLDHLLAKGGMSVVYLAHDVGGGPPVAIKILRPGLRPELRSAERFRREAKAASRIDHPNVIRIFGHGELEGGLCFLVMEFVDGTSLQRIIHDQAPLGARRAVQIAAQIADALDRAHDLGVLHRDLKPANVLLVHRHKEPDSVRILDFGLAKIRGHDEADTLTKAGLIFGTPEYMSPEQAVSTEVDGRCDIYSLGAILYEMLVARPPFKGDGVFETVRMHVAEQPKAPRDVRSDVSLPPMLERIVLRCLEKRPDNRFRTAGSLARALRAVGRQLAGPIARDREEPETDSQGATMGQDRAALLDSLEAPRGEYLQLRRHRQETLRRVVAALETSPQAEELRELLARAAGLEQEAVDRGADLAVAESGVEEAQGKAREQISQLRLACIDKQMEATRLREELESTGPVASMEQRLAAVAHDIADLEISLHSAERDLAQRLEQLTARRDDRERKLAVAERAVDSGYDALAAAVRANAGSSPSDEVVRLLDDLEAFDRWIAAHDAAAGSPPAPTQEEVKG